MQPNEAQTPVRNVVCFFAVLLATTAIVYAVSGHTPLHRGIGFVVSSVLPLATIWIVWGRERRRLGRLADAEPKNTEAVTYIIDFYRCVIISWLPFPVFAFAMILLTGSENYDPVRDDGYDVASMPYWWARNLALVAIAVGANIGLMVKFYKSPNQFTGGIQRYNVLCWSLQLPVALLLTVIANVNEL